MKFASTRGIPEALFVGAGIAFLLLSKGVFKMVNVYNQGITTRGCEREDTSSLSLPALSPVFPKHCNCQMKHMEKMEIIAMFWNEQCLRKHPRGVVTQLKKKKKKSGNSLEE